MRTAWLLLLIVASATGGAGCATESSASRIAWTAPIAAKRCDAVPVLSQATGFRHVRNRIAAGLGDVRHRGVDLIATPASEQVIEGELHYTAIDKAIEDEDVEIYACVDSAWRRLGTARSDGEGHFALALAGDARLPLGAHELVMSMPADRSAAVFGSFVVPVGTRLAVCDVDGTLTSAENAVIAEVVVHASVGMKRGAAAALDALVARGYQPVYLTARARGYSELTRRWLAGRGFPSGPVIVANGITLPGAAARIHKQHALAWLHARGLEIAIGIGNRATDIDAYAQAGVRADRIFIEASQYASELRAPIAGGHAVGFTSYDTLQHQIIERLQ